MNKATIGNARPQCSTTHRPYKLCVGLYLTIMWFTWRFPTKGVELSLKSAYFYHVSRVILNVDRLRKDEHFFSELCWTLGWCIHCFNIKSPLWCNIQLIIINWLFIIIDLQIVDYGVRDHPYATMVGPNISVILWPKKQSCSVQITCGMFFVAQAPCWVTAGTTYAQHAYHYYNLN